jgi:protein SCO1/2
MRPVPRGRADTRRRSVVIARLLWIALAIMMLALAACDSSEVAHNLEPAAGSQPVEHSGMDHGAMEHRDLDATEPTDFSIYHAESAWTDQTGEERQLESLAGRVQVVAMLYTSCAYACPRIMLDMKRIEGELGAQLSEDVGFVVVSIDPERDTPEQLAEFASGSMLDPETWTLLTGEEGDILELAALLGVQYRETKPGEWVHSNLVTVLDQEGVVAHRQLGLGTDPAETLDVIRDLAAR